MIRKHRCPHGGRWFRSFWAMRAYCATFHREIP